LLVQAWDIRKMERSFSLSTFLKIIIFHPPKRGGRSKSYCEIPDNRYMKKWSIGVDTDQGSDQIDERKSRNRREWWRRFLHFQDFILHDAIHRIAFDAIPLDPLGFIVWDFDHVLHGFSQLSVILNAVIEIINSYARERCLSEISDKIFTNFAWNWWLLPLTHFSGILWSVFLNIASDSILGNLQMTLSQSTSLYDTLFDLFSKMARTNWKLLQFFQSA
jgi:hypothetical protein